MAFFTLVQGSVFVTSATNLPASTPVQILEKGVQGPKGTAGAAGSFPIVATPVVLGVTPLAGSLVNGMLAYVLSRTLHYKYDATSVAVADGSDIIVAAGGIGRWFSTPLVPLQPGTVGFVLTNAGPGGNPTWSLPPGGPPSGAAGGDLTGTYPNPTVRSITMQGTTDFLAAWTAPAPLGVKGDFEIHAQDSSGADAGGNVVIRSGAATTIAGFGGNIDFVPGNDGVASGTGDTRLMKGSNVVLMMDGTAAGTTGKMMFGTTGPQAAGIGSIGATVGAGKVRDDRSQRAFPGSAQAGGDWNLTLGASSAGAPYTTAILINREVIDTAVETDWFTSFGLVPCTTENGNDGAIDVYGRGNFAWKYPFQSDPGLNGGSLTIRAQQGGTGATTLGGGVNISSNSGGLASGAINLIAPFGGDGNAGMINFIRGGNALLTMNGLVGLGFFQFGGIAGTIVPGFRQVQSTTGAGMAWEDRTQAALAGSNTSGGTHNFIIGKRDGAAFPGEFRFCHESVAGSTFFPCLAIRPSATINSGMFMQVKNSNAFTLEYDAPNAAVLSAPLTIRGQGNTNPVGTGGMVIIGGGDGSGGAAGGTVRLDIGGGAAGGRIEFSSASVPSIQYANDNRFTWASGSLIIGSGQAQATGASSGTVRIERTQAAAAGSGLQGGDFDFVMGRPDAAATSDFRFGRESVAESTYFTGLSIRPGSTQNSDLLIFKEGNAGNLRIIHGATSTTTSGDVEIAGQTGTGVPGGDVILRPGPGTVDGDVAFFDGTGTVSKLKYDGGDNRIEASVPYCGDPAAGSFRLGYLDIVAVAGSTTLTAAQSANGVLRASGVPGAVFTWRIMADLGHLLFIRNDTANTLTVLTTGGAGFGAASNITATNHALFFVVNVGGVTEAVRIN